MIDKILDIVKMIFEKYLYKALLSMAMAIIIFALKSNWFINMKLSKVESVSLIFALSFIILAILEYIIVIFKGRWNDYHIKVAERKEAEREYNENIRKMKDGILNLPNCDKDILYSFIQNKNDVYSLNCMEYFNGTLIHAEMYNPLYRGRNMVSASQGIDIIKKYSNEEGINCVDFKLEDNFYNLLQSVFEKYGKKCFEY